MRLRDYKVKKLSNQEVKHINGGENGWFYLGRAYGAIYDSIIRWQAYTARTGRTR